MDQLQQLDRELDITEPAAPEFDLPLFLGGRNVFRDPAPHGLHRLHKPFASCGIPDQRRDGLFVAAAQCHVAGDGAGLQERLELPAFRPAGVVAFVRRQRPHQGPGLAFRAQVRVHFPQPRLAGDRRNGPRDAAGEGGADGVGPRIIELGGVDHVDHVDVGNVVQFAGAALAHPDDGKADVRDVGCAELLGRLGARHRQGSFDGGAGQVGQLGPDGGHEVQRVGGAQVLNGQVHHTAAVGGT